MRHVVLCVRYGAVIMYHGVREERLLRREGGGGGGGGGGEVLFESRPWYQKQLCWNPQHPGQADLQYIKGQIGGFVLHKLYHRCRP